MDGHGFVHGFVVASGTVTFRALSISGTQAAARRVRLAVSATMVPQLTFPPMPISPGSTPGGKRQRH